jgi:DNA-binding transcriptional LysR family regulator
MLNLRRIDLNLLTVFEVVYEERNQRKAAERLYLTQPAVSAAIARLREIVNDKLFTTTPKGLAPTTKAEDLYKSIHMALGVIRSNLEVSEAFNPSDCQRVFKMAVDYGSAAAFAVPLFMRVRESAPQAVLQLMNLPDKGRARDLLHDREIDVVSSQYRLSDPGIESIPVNWHVAVLIVREGHPRITQRPEVSGLVDEEFVLVHGQPTSYDHAEIDNLLACIRDRVVLEVPSATVIPGIVRKTNLVSIMSRQTLEAMDELRGLQVFEIPIDYTPAPAFIHWRQELDTDPAAVWFKNQVIEVFRTLASTPQD